MTNISTQQVPRLRPGEASLSILQMPALQQRLKGHSTHVHCESSLAFPSYSGDTETQRWQDLTELAVTEPFLWVKHRSMCFTGIDSFKPHSVPQLGNKARRVKERPKLMSQLGRRKWHLDVDI